MRTVCVDTNILARFFLGRKDELGLKSWEIINGAEKGLYLIFLDQIVIAELVWLLSSYYKYERKEIGGLLMNFMGEKYIHIDGKNAMIRAVGLYQSTSLGFVDCWLAVISKSNGYELITFDKKLKKVG